MSDLSEDQTPATEGEPASGSRPATALQIILPVHNEGACIAEVVREMYAKLEPHLSVEFIVCEDGSRDNTKEVLRELATTLPMQLIMSDARKGYSRAVIDGLKASSANYVFLSDSDGQFPAEDIWRFYREREDYDVVLAWRTRRIDNVMRRFISGSFKWVFGLMFSVPVHDPSCGFFLARQSAVRPILGDLGVLDLGFVYEFVARIRAKGGTIKEIPIAHSARKTGETQIYHLRALPRIATSHLIGLVRIWWDIRKNY